jgi:putative ABC transport system permease protein
MSVPQISRRERKSHLGRTLLTLLSVVMGVAVIVAVSMATKATRRAYGDLYETLTGKADLQVAAGLGTGFDQTLYVPINEIKDLSAVVPVVQRNTILYPPDKASDGDAPNRRAQVIVMGIDTSNKTSMSEFRLVEGEKLNNTGIVLEQAFAKQLDIKAGDSVKLLTKLSIKPVAIKVLGIVEPAGGSKPSQGMVYMTIKTAQKLFRMKDKDGVIYLDAIYLHVKDGVPIEKVQAEVAKLLPDGVRVEPPPSRSALADQSLMSMYQGLNLASSLSILVAAFIILNTFLMTVAQRQKQMAVLRAIGATKRQVMSMVLREGLWFGILGSTLGVALGIGGAMMLTKLIGRMFGGSMPQPELTLPICLAGLATGVGVSLLASFFPARSASKISPLLGMRDVISQDEAKPSYLWPAVGAVLVVISACVIVTAAYGFVPIWVSIVGVLLLFVSLVLVLPLLLIPAAKLLGAVIYPVFGFSGELAQRQLLRRRSRSILTMGVLFVSAATGIGTGVTVLNDSQDVDTWFERSVGGDFFVRAMMLDMGTGQTADLPPEVGEEIAAVDGIDKLFTARLVSTKLFTTKPDSEEVNEEYVVVMARQFPKTGSLYLDLREGEEENVRERLQQGDVVIGSVLSQRTGKEVGDTIEIDSKNGIQKLNVVGIANDYSAAGLIVYIDKEEAQQRLGITGVDVYIVRADESKLAKVEASLEKITKERGLMLQSFADLQRLVQGIKNGIVGSLWGLLALGFIVATFGIANTLAMNVLEQTREIGLLRMIAMTRKQVRQMIMAQAIILAILGLTPGIIAGLIMAVTSSQTTEIAFGHSSEFHWHFELLAVMVVAAGGIILFAAILPAVRAARLPPGIAVRYE